jgi:hypothetical protein
MVRGSTRKGAHLDRRKLILSSTTPALLILPVAATRMRHPFRCLPSGNATYAAIAAVVAANMVLVAYVTVAFKEDQQAQNHSAASKKKV